MIARNVTISIVSNMIAEEGAVLLLHLASTKLYSKVPYFSSPKRSANPLTLSALRDWVRGNGIVQIFGGGIMLGTCSEAKRRGGPAAAPCTAVRVRVCCTE